MSATPTTTDLRAVADLVRLPAVLSVPGDVLAGASATRPHGAPLPARTAGLALGSCLLYLGGMALNDVSDTLVDAVERPERPIPSGRVPLGTARTVARGLLGGGLLACAVADRRSLRVAVPLVAAIVAYDTRAAGTAAGPPVMAACRTLDVLLGADPDDLAAALPAALGIGAHTLVLTTVSRHEVDGADPATVRRATGAGLGVLAAVGAAALRGRRPDALLALLPLVDQARRQARAGAAAAADPSPAALQRVVVTAVLGMAPLQSTAVLARGHRVLGAVLAGLAPLARRIAARRRVT